MIKTVNYDNISHVYDSSRIANFETTKELEKVLGINNTSLILDIGSGTGNYSATLSRKVLKVIGIDISIKMIEHAIIKYPNLTFVCCDVTSLPFNADTFDGAVAIQVLHHVKGKQEMLSEAYRVLKKGSRIALHQCSHQQMRAFWFYRYFPKGLEVDLARMPDFCEIRTMMEIAGFKNIGSETCYQDEVVANETPESYLKKIIEIVFLPSPC